MAYSSSEGHMRNSHLSQNHVSQIWKRYDRNQAGRLLHDQWSSLMQDIHRKDQPNAEDLPEIFVKAIYLEVLGAHPKAGLSRDNFLKKFNDYWSYRSEWFQYFLSEGNLGLPEGGPTAGTVIAERRRANAVAEELEEAKRLLVIERERSTFERELRNESDELRNALQQSNEEVSELRSFLKKSGMKVNTRLWNANTRGSSTIPRKNSPSPSPSLSKVMSQPSKSASSRSVVRGPTATEPEGEPREGEAQGEELQRMQRQERKLGEELKELQLALFQERELRTTFEEEAAKIQDLQRDGENFQPSKACKKMVEERRMRVTFEDEMESAQGNEFAAQMKTAAEAAERERAAAFAACAQQCISQEMEGIQQEAAAQRQMLEEVEQMLEKTTQQYVVSEMEARARVRYLTDELEEERLHQPRESGLVPCEVLEIVQQELADEQRLRLIQEDAWATRREALQMAEVVTNGQISLEGIQTLDHSLQMKVLGDLQTLWQEMQGEQRLRATFEQERTRVESLRNALHDAEHFMQTTAELKCLTLELQSVQLELETERRLRMDASEISAASTIQNSLGDAVLLAEQSKTLKEMGVLEPWQLPSPLNPLSAECPWRLPDPWQVPSSLPGQNWTPEPGINSLEFCSITETDSVFQKRIQEFYPCGVMRTSNESKIDTSCIRDHGSSGQRSPSSDAFHGSSAIQTHTIAAEPHTDEIQRTKEREAQILEISKGESWKWCNRHVSRLHHSDGSIRRAAVEALGQICMSAQNDPGHSSNSIIVAEEVSRLLGDSSVAVRGAAATALGRMADAGAQYATEVAQLLNDTEAEVRGAAVGSLGNMGPQGARHAGAVAQLMQDPDENVRYKALTVLGFIGQASAALSQG